jgi:hypothetical protein
LMVRSIDSSGVNARAAANKCVDKAENPRRVTVLSKAWGGADAHPNCTRRGQLGIANGVLDRLVTQIVLNGPRIGCGLQSGVEKC